MIDKHGNCDKCGGVHFGSGRDCPYRCERCTVNTEQCFQEGCPRNARFAAENAKADERIAAEKAKGSLPFYQQVARQRGDAVALAQAADDLDKARAALAARPEARAQEPVAWAVYDEPTEELIDVTLVKPDGGEPGLRYEPLYMNSDGVTK